MANVKIVQRAFSGGELSAELFGRFDDAKYQSGLARCRNFLTTPHGPLHNRGGLAFVAYAKYEDRRTRLLSFIYSADQTMAIEAGAGYFRFHTLGKTLVNEGGTPYEIASPYAETDLWTLKTVQSGDVMTLVTPNHAPHELRRLGALHWELKPIAFDSELPAPGQPTAVASGHTAVKYQYRYQVTAHSADGKSETAASPAVQASGNLFETGAKVTISWPAVAAASAYSVYKEQGGLFGYIGQTENGQILSLVDDNIAPDLTKTPPRYENDLFEGAGNYPCAVSYFEQRRAFAGTDNQPLNLWLSRSGTESNMSYSLPSLAEDRIALRVAAREASRILHLVPLNQLIILTASAEWLITTNDTDTLTSTTINVRPQSYVGAAPVAPVVVNNSLIYAAARGGHLRELAYQWQAGGFISGDLSLRSAHLFDDKQIVDLAYSQAPFPVIWAVSSSGELLGLTYVPEQEVGGYHVHDTKNGAFESIAVVHEGERDVLYAVIRRTLNGQTRRTIERMEGRHEGADAFYVDCGATYQGAPATTVSGLDWLEGETVSILADGAVIQPQAVQNAAITLPEAASVVQVGLPISAEAVTLPLAFELNDGSFGLGWMKNINKLWLRVVHSGGFLAGPSWQQLTAYPPRRTEPYGSPPALRTETLALVLSPQWQDSGQLYLRHSDPLPLTVVSLTMEVAV